MLQPKVNDVADLIITRYGALDSAQAAAARQAIELFVRKSLISLNSTHLRLLNADNDESTSSVQSDNPPSHNWARLMAELFGAEHGHLLDLILDPVIFGDDPQRVFAVDGNHRISPIKKIVAATGVFLVAEANRMQCWLDDAEVEPATVHEIQRDIVGVTTCSVALNRSVSDGTWADVLARALAPEMVGSHDSLAEHGWSLGHKVYRSSDRRLGADRSGNMRDSGSHRSAVTVQAAPRFDQVQTAPGFDHALEVFRRAAHTVPAYRDFLSRHGVDAAKVRTPEDFTTIPPMTKANYLQQYPREELMWDGDITQAGMWSPSSGSSGQPTYWPRNEVAADDSQLLFDRIFRRKYESHQRSTLVVIGFAMGQWIGGTYTLDAMLGLRQRGHRLSVITPGIDIQEIVASISTLGPSYDQVVLAGYPPFVRDVLYEAPEDVRHDLRILVWGENITELWRSHILGFGVADVCALYGTTGAGLIGYETPTTIAVRKLAQDDGRLSDLLFGSGESIQPTFVEYDPQLRYIESTSNEDDNLLLTVDSAIPLIRYGSIDRGQVITVDQLDRAMCDLGARLDLGDSSSAAFLSVKVKQPFDVVASFYAVNIYPDAIRTSLEDSRMAEAVSGKFAVFTQEADDDLKYSSVLELEVELRPGVGSDPSLAERLQRDVTDRLKRTNSEYAQLHAAIGARAEPRVRLYGFGTDRFTPDVKTVWSESTNTSGHGPTGKPVTIDDVGPSTASGLQPVRLSTREVEVLLAWFHAETKAAAAEEFARRTGQFISLGTVNTHLARIRYKYEAAGRAAPTKAALVVRALQDQLIQIDDL